jgi:hypothetical protein
MVFFILALFSAGKAPARSFPSLHQQAPFICLIQDNCPSDWNSTLVRSEVFKDIINVSNIRSQHITAVEYYRPRQGKISTENNGKDKEKPSLCGKHKSFMLRAYEIIVLSLTSIVLNSEDKKLNTE